MLKTSATPIRDHTSFYWLKGVLGHVKKKYDQNGEYGTNGGKGGHNIVKFVQEKHLTNHLFSALTFVENHIDIKLPPPPMPIPRFK